MCCLFKCSAWYGSFLNYEPLSPAFPPPLVSLPLILWTTECWSWALPFSYWSLIHWRPFYCILYYFILFVFQCLGTLYWFILKTKKNKKRWHHITCNDALNFSALAFSLSFHKISFDILLRSNSQVTKRMIDLGGVIWFMERS